MNRIERVINELKQNDLTQMIVSETIAIRYLTGVSVYPGERLFALLLREDGNHVFSATGCFSCLKSHMRSSGITMVKM